MKLNRWDPVQVNNAAITGVKMDSDAVRASASNGVSFQDLIGFVWMMQLLEEG